LIQQNPLQIEAGFIAFIGEKHCFQLLFYLAGNLT
jgi:hypothetical protein